MFKLWQNKLQVRLNSLFMLGLVVIVATMTALTVWQAKTVLVEREQQLIEKTRDLIITQLGYHLDGAQSLSLILTELVGEFHDKPQLLKDVIPKQLDQQNLRLLVAGGGVWPAPYKLDPEKERASFFWGREINGNLKLYDAYNQDDQAPYFQQEWFVPTQLLEYHKDTCYWSASYIDPYTGETMVTCSSAIYQDDEFWGVSSVDLSLAGLDYYLASKMEKLGGYSIILDRNLNIISAPRELLPTSKEYPDGYSNLGQLVKASPEYKVFHEALKPFQQLAASSSSPKVSFLLENIPSLSLADAVRIANSIENKNARNFLEDGNYNVPFDPILKEESNLYIQPMAMSDWLVITAVPTRLELSNVYQFTRQFVALLVLTAGIVIAVFAMRLHYILIRPLQGMIEVLHRPEQADMDENAGYEFSAIAKAYNKQQRQLAFSSAETQAAQQHLQAMMDSALEAIITTDFNGRIIDCNPACTELFKQSQAQLKQSNIIDLCGSNSAHNLHNWLQELELNTTSTINQKEIVLGSDANSETLEISMNSFDVGARRFVNVFMRDISQRKQSEKRMHTLATRDSLTGLHNRSSFNVKLQEGITHAETDGSQTALLFIDLDHFKEVNDTLGHDIGDKLLVKVAERLNRQVRDTDTVARLGGDEFAIVLVNIQRRSDLDRIADGIINCLSQPFHIDKHDCQIGCSIGISIYPEHSDNYQDMIKQADVAMYQTKSNGRNSWCYFEQHLFNQQQQTRALQNELGHAIDGNELQLHYQPICKLGRAGVDAEALIRWYNPNRGLIPPNDFIPIAEKNGMIHEIGHWVLDTACAQMKTWQKQEYQVDCLHINVSVMQLTQVDFVQRVAQTLQRHQLDAKHIKLEITESVLIDASCKQALLALEALGVNLAIDDFGTGHSCLAYLKDFPIRTLKLDRSFVRDCSDENNNSLPICQAIVALSHSLGIDIVAEGIETQAQLEAMQLINCDSVQGYLLAKPMHVLEFCRWMSKQDKGQSQSA